MFVNNSEKMLINIIFYFLHITFFSIFAPVIQLTIPGIEPNH
jgi:hypothetical protein